VSTRDILRDADPVAEVRWFVPGDVSRSLRPPGGGLKRTDWYHLETLSPARSIKRRGDRVLEQKWKVGPTSVFDGQPVDGYAERWVKQRLGKTTARRHLHGTWIPIAKQLWRVGNVQIGRLRIAGDEWWTVAVALPGGDLDSSAAQFLDRWAATLSSRGHCSAYPAWVLTRTDEAETAVSHSERAC
jgi:hypothetical protein